MEEGKQIKGKSKRQRTNGRRDRLSELPDCVLLHIMNFMDTNHAARTCVLSKRWKNLWKCLATLSFHRGYFKRIVNFNKFVSQVLSSRDGSTSVLNLRYSARGTTASKLLNKVLTYAVVHNVQQLTIETDFNPRNMPNFFDTLIFSCTALTFLELYISGPPLQLPKFLQLPALKNLLLANVTFTASDNGCAEPFSTCNLLNTLVLKECSLHNDAKILFMSNSNLSSLNLHNTFRASARNPDTSQHKIVLSTPNLISLMVTEQLSFSYHQLSSACNLSFLEEGSIHNSTSHIVGWLQVFANVKTLTLYSGTLWVILKALSNLATMKTQPPCFVRLESLKVKMNMKISDEDVNKVVEYLLQNSPLTRVAVIKVLKFI